MDTTNSGDSPSRLSRSRQDVNDFMAGPGGAVGTVVLLLLAALVVYAIVAG